MAVLRELFQSREPDLGERKASFNRIFLVTGTPEIAVDDVGLPAPGAAFPTRPLAKAIGRQATRLTADRSIVTIDYEIPGGGGGGGWSRAAGDWTYHWDCSPVYEREYIDLLGQPLGPEGKGVDILRPHGVLSYTQWDCIDRRNHLYSYYGCINGYTWWGVPAGALQFQGVSVTPLSSHLFRHDYTIELNAAGFQPAWYETDKRTNLPVGAISTGTSYYLADFNEITGTSDPVLRTDRLVYE